MSSGHGMVIALLNHRISCFSLQDQASKNSGINGAGILQVPSLPEEFLAGVGCWGLQVPFLPEELLADVDSWGEETLFYINLWTL